MSVVQDMVGHGIGRQFHAAPAVLHHANQRPGTMQLGQTFTIEPILTLGSRHHRYVNQHTAHHQQRGNSDALLARWHRQHCF
jgi:methionine aminopeptidase